MANVDRAIGLRPLRHLGGGEVRSNAYSIASGYATALGAGDPVKMTGTGRNIARAAGGDVVVGVFDGCRYTDQTGARKYAMYWPAGQVATEIEALVYDDPMISFRVQADTVAEADVGLLADLDDATPSAVTGLSGVELAATGAAATGKTCRILGVIDEVHNAYGAHADVEVLFIEHALKGVVAGVGGN
jgi:hypothetical protein